MQHRSDKRDLARFLNGNQKGRKKPVLQGLQGTYSTLRWTIVSRRKPFFLDISGVCFFFFVINEALRYTGVEHNETHSGSYTNYAMLKAGGGSR